MVAAVMLALATLSPGGIDSTNCGDRPATARVEPSPVHIWLQIVRATPTTRQVLDTMVAAAADIWAPYNVLVSPVYSLSRPDNREGQWITLVLRNQPANRIDGKPPRGHRALASLTFTAETPGDVMYGSLETARYTAQTAGLGKGAAPVQELFAAQLLGQAIAHELGHYLLRSSRHSKEGLMRASFGAADLLSQNLKRFRLLPEQAATLTRSVRGRCMPPDAP